MQPPPPTQQILQQIPQPTPQQCLQPTPQPTPQQIPQPIPQPTPQPTPQQCLQPTPQQCLQPTPQQCLQPTPQQCLQQIPQQIPQQNLQQDPQQTPHQPPSSDAPDPAECYAKRRRSALRLTVSLLLLSLVVLVVGLVCATLTDNVAVAGYYPGIILSFGAFLGIVGLHLSENRRHMLIGAIIFICLGVIAAFICAIMDGIIASKYIDSQPLVEGSCGFYSSPLGYTYDSYYTEIKCPSHNGGCNLKVRSNTCYCCYLHNCPSEYHDMYYVFTGVSSCWDVIHLHRLLWVSVVINILAFFLGTISAALLGAYKDLPKPSLQTSPSPVPPPHILYNPTRHMLTYHYPLQDFSNYPALPTSQLSPEGNPASTCPPDESRGPHPPALPPPQDGGLPGLYTLTPNAPALYGAGPCEKPPPYAY